jgi:glycosyltransferase involved in cell wall biosynthesis
VDGIRELIEDGVNGHLAKGTNADALTEAIQRAVSLPCDSIVTEAVKTIRDNFSIETVTKKEKELIGRIMT